LSSRLSTTASPYSLEYYWYNGGFNGPLFTFTTGGNLGIGTASPQARLHVYGTSGTTARIALQDTTSTDYAPIYIYNDVGLIGGIQGIGSQYSTSKIRNDIEVFSTSSGADVNMVLDNAGTTFNVMGPGRAEILTATTAGNVGIGTTNPGSYKLYVAGSAYKTDGSPDWAYSSDERLKKNIKTITAALEKISKLRGVTFEWKEPQKHGNRTGMQMSMIAQDVEKVFPKWVKEDSEGYKVLETVGLDALAIEGIKELKKENDALEAKNAQLEARIKRLEAKLSP
jgi:hypothetical protein